MITTWNNYVFPESLKGLSIDRNKLTNWEGCILPDSLGELAIHGNNISSWNGCKLPDSLWYLDINDFGSDKLMENPLQIYRETYV